MCRKQLRGLLRPRTGRGCYDDGPEGIAFLYQSLRSASAKRLGGSTFINSLHRISPCGGTRKVISYLRGLQIQEVRVAIGDRIREVRKAAGLTQEDVARRAGITLKAVGELERSEVQDPHISSLTKISRALDVEVADLLREPVPLGEAPAGAEPATSYSFEIATAPEVLLEGLHNLGIPAGWTEAEALSQWLRRHAEN